MEIKNKLLFKQLFILNLHKNSVVADYSVEANCHFEFVLTIISFSIVNLYKQD